MDKDATQDAKVNCSSFNYARRNDEVHRVLDVEPSNPTYEPQFRENSKCVLDNNGNQVKDGGGHDAIYKASEFEEMRKYAKEVKTRQAKFRSEVFACIKQ